MIDKSGIKARFDALAPFLNERDRRLFAASEARAAGRGGIAAVAEVTGIARSTIGRGLTDLRSGSELCSSRVRRPGGGGKPATETQPGLLAALEELVQSSIRGHPEAPLRWVSKSQRHLSAALTARGFVAGQKLVGRLLSVSIKEGLPHSWCKSIIETGSIRARRRSTPALPYIDRLSVFRRLICPSV